MYVVKRSFWDGKKFYGAGSVVDLASLPELAYHTRVGHVVKVEEHSFSKWSNFFKVKYKVDIPNVFKKETTEYIPVKEEPKKKAIKVAKVVAAVSK